MKIDLDQPGAVLDIDGAAAYLGVSIRVVRHHIYVSHKLIPDGRAGDLHPCFTTATLDTFAANPDAFKRGRRWRTEP